MSERLIDEITEDRRLHYEPFGWHHWPEHPWMSYQFRCVLGETQEGTISECCRVASRMVPGEEETGAERCQHDNPTIGEEYMFDWFAERFGIDE